MHVDQNQIRVGIPPRRALPPITAVDERLARLCMFLEEQFGQSITPIEHPKLRRKDVKLSDRDEVKSEDDDPSDQNTQQLQLSLYIKVSYFLYHPKNSRYLRYFLLFFIIKQYGLYVQNILEIGVRVEGQAKAKLGQIQMKKGL